MISQNGGTAPASRRRGFHPPTCRLWRIGRPPNREHRVQIGLYRRVRHRRLGCTSEPLL